MNIVSNLIVNQAKDFVKETIKEISDEVKSSAKDKIKEVVINKSQNIFNKNNLKNNECNMEDAVSSITTQISLITAEDNQNEDKYMEMLESKIVNGKVTESSKYFLKLKRESLKISEIRAKELEEIVLNR